MATWPESLPQNFHQQGLSIQLPEGAIRTDMDTGKPFQRKRFTSAVQTVQGRMWLTSSQYSDLLEFWDNTLAMGSLEFDWVHPITRDSAKFRFIANSPPTVSVISGGLYQVQIRMEIIP